MRLRVVSLISSILLVVVLSSATAAPNPIGGGREYGTPDTLAAVVKARHKQELERYKFLKKQQKRERKRIAKLRKKREKEAARRRKRLEKARKKLERERARQARLAAKQRQRSAGQSSNGGEGDKSLKPGEARKKRSFWSRFWSSLISGAGG